MDYKEASRIRAEFEREYLQGKPWSTHVVMCNLVRKWNDSREPWYIKVHISTPVPSGIDIPESYKGLRIEVAAFGTRR